MGMRPLGFTYADILNCYVTTTHLKQESRLYLLFLILFTFLIALTGFLVTPSAQCPANEERFSSSGVILSPGFPSNYPNSQTCSWLLRMIPGTVCILSVCLSMGLHMCVGIILWLKTYHLHLDATKETDLFTARTKIWNLTHSLSEMTLKLCVIYLTLTCFILEPDRPLCLHLVFQPKYAYICIQLCMCLCICYTLCVACYSTFALGSKWLLPPPQVTPSISMWRCSTARSSLMNWRFLMVNNPFLHLLHLHTHAYSDPALIYVFLFKIPTVPLIRYIILNSHLGC